jgi:GT2 family glycosyltransferase
MGAVRKAPKSYRFYASFWIKRFMPPRILQQSWNRGASWSRQRLADVVPRLAPGLTQRLLQRHGLGPMPAPEAADADAADAGMNFEIRPYLAQWPGPPPANPELHYLWVGARKGLRPNPRFDAADYLREFPDVRVSGYQPFAHARRFGAADGRLRGRQPPGREPPIPTLDAVLALPPLAESRTAAVDVIVPVFKGLDNALRTIASVLVARDPYPHALVVIDDASPEPGVHAALQALAARGLIQVICHDRNQGFVRSVNAGMAEHPKRDVVLLNSDTAVFGQWLTRLMATFARQPAAATLTPLSNSATILSYPIWLRDNVLPAGLAAHDLDGICADLDLPPIEIPTGVGFCMAIRRAAANQIGPFNAEAFGQGYGEENDICRRAVQRGWQNYAVCNTFVWHQGGATFGAERAARVAAAQTTLEHLHPGYRRLVHRFIRRDPLAPVRAALDLERLRRDPRRKVLHGRNEPVGSRTPAQADTLPVRLIADLPPYAGRARLVPDGPDAYPNLQRVSHGFQAADLARLLVRSPG